MWWEGCTGGVQMINPVCVDSITKILIANVLFKYLCLQVVEHWKYGGPYRDYRRYRVKSLSGHAYFVNKTEPKILCLVPRQTSFLVCDRKPGVSCFCCCCCCWRVTGHWLETTTTTTKRSSPLSPQPQATPTFSVTISQAQHLSFAQYFSLKVCVYYTISEPEHIEESLKNESNTYQQVVLCFLFLKCY